MTTNIKDNIQKYFNYAFIVVCIIVIIINVVIVLEKNNEYIPSFGGNTSIKSDLIKSKANAFEQAISKYKPISPQNAVSIWVDGIKNNNFATQYSAMGGNLKNDIYEHFESVDWYNTNSTASLDSSVIVVTSKSEEIASARVDFLFTSKHGNEKYTVLFYIRKIESGWLIFEIDMSLELAKIIGYK